MAEEKVESIRQYVQRRNDEFDQWLDAQNRSSLVEVLSRTLDNLEDHARAARLNRELYPLTVTLPRYGGTYEGGDWIAFPCRPTEIPDEAFGSDVPCAAWWNKNRHLVGLGYTSAEAVADLAIKKRDGGWTKPVWIELEAQESEDWWAYHHDGTRKTYSELTEMGKWWVEKGLGPDWLEKPEEGEDIPDQDGWH